MNGLSKWTSVFLGTVLLLNGFLYYYDVDGYKNIGGDLECELMEPLLTINLFFSDKSESSSLSLCCRLLMDSWEVCFFLFSLGFLEDKLPAKEAD